MSEDWIEGDWIEAAHEWVEGVVLAVVSVLRGKGRRKPPISATPRRTVNKQRIRKYAAEMRSKEENEKERQRLLMAQEAALERSQYFRDMALMGVDKRKAKKALEKQKRAERDNNLSKGREIRRQQLQKKANTVPKSDVAEYVERRRRNRDKMARARAAKRYRHRSD